jgi:tRNA(Arg) A34 adenosine deaminase TadA
MTRATLAAGMTIAKTAWQADTVMTQQTFMQRAGELALEKMRDDDGGPFGAVVVHDGKIVAEGWNQVTSANDPTAHAEMVAIRKACAALGRFDLSDCDIFTSCEPCPMCMGAVYWARLRRLYYAKTQADAAQIGFDDAFIYRELALPLAQRAIPMVQIADAGADLAFREWAQSPDKTRY